MLKRAYSVIAVFAIVTMALIACGRDKTAVAATPTVETAKVVVSTTEAETPEPQPSTPTSTHTPVSPASPTPLAVATNGGAPIVDQVSLGSGGEELSTVEVVKILRPSVVQVVTEILTMGSFNQPEPSAGVGTGVLLDEEGHILTNNHVVAGAQRIDVTLSNEESFPAVIVGRDPDTDLAIIRIEAGGLKPAKLGISSQVQVGEDVIAIGHALGLRGGPTVSKGVISALGRSIDTDQQATIVDLIQTDTSINPGNSGGPLVNTRAEVIGINTAIIQGGRGIGFAINIDDAKVVAAQLMEKGYVERGFLGVTPFNLTPGLAMRFDLPVTEGIIVARVVPGTAAEAAGLRPEDIIVQLGDEPIRNTGELSKFLISHLPGERVDLVYFRGGRKVSTEVTLGERPKEG